MFTRNAETLHSSEYRNIIIIANAHETVNELTDDEYETYLSIINIWGRFREKGPNTHIITFPVSAIEM